MRYLHELREESKEGSETRFLWHNSYWDGPQSGMMLWNGGISWFVMYKETYDEVPMDDVNWKEWCDYHVGRYGKLPPDYSRIEHERTRFFKVYKLPKDIQDAIIHNHKLFQKYVGLHTDYDINGKRGRGASSSNDLGDLKPYNLHKKFYNAKSNKNWLVKLLPFLFKKEDLYIEYKLELDKYEIIGEFKDY